MALPAILTLLIAQLIGETICQGLHLTLPGPVVGMALLVIAFAARPPLIEKVRPVGQGLLGHLSLLFVPAGVGIVGHLDELGRAGLAMLIALVVSTALTITVAALTFTAVAKCTARDHPT